VYDVPSEAWSVSGRREFTSTTMQWIHE
jgi:hypothetical protein